MFADGHLGCFQYLAVVNCAAMNIGVHRFFWIGVSGFLEYNPSSGLGSRVGTVGRGDCRNYYKGHMDKIRGGWWRWGREVGSAGLGWRDGEKRHTTVIE